MKYRILTIFLFGLAIVSFSNLLPTNNREVLGASTEDLHVDSEDLLNNSTKIETETAFDQREETVYEPIPYETEYVENDEMEYGTEKIVEEGENGTKALTYLITFWGDEEINRQLIDTQIDEPKTEVIEEGTKIVWREYMTDDVGGVWYWHKMEVWATKYDANCIGCTGRTYSGTEVKKGVCATDPDVIPLGTNFYVDGYGICRAEDIGGAIKGDKIDLGFKDASKGNWGAAYTDIYLLTNSPEPRD